MTNLYLCLNCGRRFSPAEGGCICHDPDNAQPVDVATVANRIADLTDDMAAGRRRTLGTPSFHNMVREAAIEVLAPMLEGV